MGKKILTLILGSKKTVDKRKNPDRRRTQDPEKQAIHFFRLGVMSLKYTLATQIRNESEIKLVEQVIKDLGEKTARMEFRRGDRRGSVKRAA